MSDAVIVRGLWAVWDSQGHGGAAVVLSTGEEEASDCNWLACLWGPGVAESCWSSGRV